MVKHCALTKINSVTVNGGPASKVGARRAGGARWLKYDEYKYEYEYDWLKPKVRCKADR